MLMLPASAQHVLHIYMHTLAWMSYLTSRCAHRYAVACTACFYVCNACGGSEYVHQRAAIACRYVWYLDTRHQQAVIIVKCCLHKCMCQLVIANRTNRSPTALCQHHVPQGLRVTGGQAFYLQCLGQSPLAVPGTYPDAHSPTPACPTAGSVLSVQAVRPVGCRRRRWSGGVQCVLMQTPWTVMRSGQCGRGTACAQGERGQDCWELWAHALPPVTKLAAAWTMSC